MKCVENELKFLGQEPDRTLHELQSYESIMDYYLREVMDVDEEMNTIFPANNIGGWDNKQYLSEVINTAYTLLEESNVNIGDRERISSKISTLKLKLLESGFN